MISDTAKIAMVVARVSNQLYIGDEDPEGIYEMLCAYRSLIDGSDIASAKRCLENCHMRSVSGEEAVIVDYCNHMRAMFLAILYTPLTLSPPDTVKQFLRAYHSEYQQLPGTLH